MTPTASFESEIALVAGRIGQELRDLLLKAGVAPDRPPEIAAKLGLNRNLAWKVSTIATRATPEAIAYHMPTGKARDLLRAAIARVSASADAADRADAAARDFDRLIESFAGDIATLRAMVAPLDTAGQEAQLTSARREAFTASIACWGIRAHLQYTGLIFGPVREDGLHDLVKIGGLLGLAVLRPGIRWTVLTQRSLDDAGRPSMRAAAEPLSDDASDFPAIPGFCTIPRGRIDITRCDDRVVYTLADSPVGVQAAEDVVFGTVRRGLPSRPRHPDERMEYSSRVATPVTEYLADVVYHRSHEGVTGLRAEVLSNLDGSIEFDPVVRQGLRLPVDPDIRSLGLPPRFVHSAEFDSAPIVAYAAERMGWRLEDFGAVRIRVAFPPMPSLVLIHHPLSMPGTVGQRHP